MEWTHTARIDGAAEISVALRVDSTVQPDPLAAHIKIRSVDRFAYRLTKLTGTQRAGLAAALGDDLTIEWHETARDRWRISRLGALATDIRLRLPEAYRIHRRIIDWERRFSPTGIPARAIGLDPITRRLMRRVMQDWRRVDLMNRFFGGTALARLELDVIPGLRCAAHFSIRSRPDTGREAPVLRAIETGRRIQRFWLTATQLGLSMQPNLAPLCFAHHARTGAGLWDPAVMARITRLARGLERLGSRNSGELVFLGRIGAPVKPAAKARSVRRPLEELVL
jgi:hypothetical protein